MMLTLKEVAKLLRTSPERAYQYFVKKHGLKPVATMPDRWDEAEVIALIEGREKDHKANLARDGNVTAEGICPSQHPNNSDFKQILENAVHDYPHPISHQATIGIPKHLTYAQISKIEAYNSVIDDEIYQISKMISQKFWKNFQKEVRISGHKAGRVPMDAFRHIIVPEKISSDKKLRPWHFHIIFQLSPEEQQIVKNNHLQIKSSLIGAINQVISTKYDYKESRTISFECADSDYLSYIQKGISAEMWEFHVSGQS